MTPFSIQPHRAVRLPAGKRAAKTTSRSKCQKMAAVAASAARPRASGSNGRIQTRSAAGWPRRRRTLKPRWLRRQAVLTDGDALHFGT